MRPSAARRMTGWRLGWLVAPQRFVRFAYTVAQDRLEEGVARLARHPGS